MNELDTFYLFYQDPNVGMKPVWYGSRILVEGADAEEFHVGENVTFINWGNLLIKDIKRYVYYPLKYPALF